MIEPGRSIDFTKMSGTGNDFIVFDNRSRIFSGEESEFFAAICRRRISIGADGVILLDEGIHAPVRMRYYNSDGKEAAMCANGARCSALYAYRKRFIRKDRFALEASDGPHEVKVNGERVRLQLAKPKNFETGFGIVREKGLREGGFLDTGVPHFVLFTDDPAELDRLDVEALAPFYRNHPVFKEGANVNFVQRIDGPAIRVRTFERGVEGETLSCGTGCVASALIASKTFGIPSPVRVETRGGGLNVEFDDGWSKVFLTGPVRMVFDGTLFSESPEPAS
jgi:diaminopimelate epimerase